MNVQKIINYYIYVGDSHLQEDLAKFLGVQSPSLSDWKKLGRIPQKHIQILEEKFGKMPTTETIEIDKSKVEEVNKNNFLSIAKVLEQIGFEIIECKEMIDKEIEYKQPFKCALVIKKRL